MSDNVKTRAGKGRTAVQPCFRLIYRSHSLLAPGDDAGLLDILKVARIRNADLGITGALMLYDNWFAQVLEGPQISVEALYAKIASDPRHDGVTIDQAGPATGPLFSKWAMAIVAEHHKTDMPMVATAGGLAQGAPWRLDAAQEVVLTRLRDLTRGYGRGS
jgi:hypothetical protein